MPQKSSGVVTSKTDKGEQTDQEHKKLQEGKNIIKSQYYHYCIILELDRVNREMDVVKKQAANNQAEYDRLSKENQKLQVQ